MEAPTSDGTMLLATVGSLIEAVQHGRTSDVVSTVRDDGTGLSAGAADADGCSLLHWACINNRLEIAKHLLKCGANVNAVGGVLKEVPLQWAVRNEGYGFTHLVAFLLDQGADVRHKSILGQDALFLAVMAGNANITFMLLSIGKADTNTMDSRGLNPLLWMCRKRKIAGNSNAEMVRLLLAFGADPTLADAPPNLPSGVVQHDYGGDGSYGNNCLHYLAEVGRSPVDDYLLQEIVGGSKPELLSALNSNGNTPKKVAELNNSDKVTVFLRHWAMYNALPKSLVIWTTAGLILSVYFALAALPIWHVVPFLILLGFVYERYGMQHAISLDSSRLPHGFAWGVICTTYTACVRYLAEDGGLVPGMSMTSRWAVFMFLTGLEVAICHALYTTSITDPERLRERPAHQVISGLETHTTFAPLLHRAAALSPSCINSEATLYKGRSGGEVDVGEASAVLVRTIVEFGPLNGPESESAVSKAVRERAEAEGVPTPCRVKVCPTCLLDRNVSPLPKGLLHQHLARDRNGGGMSMAGRTESRGGPETAVETSDDGTITGPDTSIVYATHCGQCNACVMNLDHHCGFVNNCVGRGNRRMFVWFCFVAGSGCLLAAGLMLFKMMRNNPMCVHRHRSPPDQTTIVHQLGVVDFVFTLACMVVRKPEVVAATLLAFLVGIWIFAIFSQQVALVATKSTTVLAMQADREFWRGSAKADIIKGEDGVEYFETSLGGSGQSCLGMVRSLVLFATEGTYEVVKRPVLKPQRADRGKKEASCCDNHGHNHHPHSSSGGAACCADSISVAKGKSRRTLNSATLAIAKAIGVKGDAIIAKEKKDEVFV